ncbi:MAG TPA: HD-GYP domain-containing protein [Fimbriimonadaceae bacterium]|nr:HD-GYP domain-containing protein [Fimbriimonadaceae bacterium]
MQRSLVIRKAQRLFLELGLVAAGLSGLVIWLVRMPTDIGPLWIVFPALALLAEFIPVEVSRRGLRITFTLPYVAGMALVAGPIGALATEVVVTTLAGALRSRRRHVEPAFLGINAAIAAIGTSGGLLALHGVRLLTSSVEVQAVAFTTGYAVLNFLLVAYVEWSTSGRSLSDNVARSLEVGVRSFLFYALLVTAVAVLVRQDMAWCIPLTLVPVWAIRTGLKQKADLYDHYYETITALTLMLQRAHPYTHAHLERVAHTAEEVARKLGLSSARARLVREAAVLHDVGKIAVDETILDKPSSLSVEELDHVRRHAEWGAEILSPVRQFASLVPWILHHHERPDGQGYPNGLSLEKIPIESRIIAVVDAFDAMTDSQDGKPGRSYRDPMTVDEAIAELERNAGTQFDSGVVKAFREVVKGG